MNLAVKLVRVRESRFMSINKRLRELFEEAGISYEVYNRPLAFTREAGAGQRSSGDHAAQVVILNVDGKLAMAVVAANQRVHLATAGASLGARQIRLASEEEFLSRFPDYAIEAMPPFGNLFGLPVYVDPEVAKEGSIFFTAGGYAQTVRIGYADYDRLVRPQVVRLAEDQRKHAA